VAGAEEQLVGGVANKGAVVRVGDTVRRPAGPWSATTRSLLEHLESVGFDEAPRYLGTDEQGRDVLSYIEGVVPLPPFPDWSMTDDVLVDLAGLLRRYHQAVASFDPGDPGVRKHVIKGGSFLCSPDYCYRYRPAAREAGPTDTGENHIGFRTVVRAGPPPAGASRHDG